MVPKGWKRVPIKDVCESIIDCVNKTAPVVDYETPFKMIRTTNVRNGRVNTEDVRYVTEDTYLQWVRRGKPQVGDIIFTREAPVGEAGVLQDAEGIFLGQRTMMYRADTCLSDNYFLFYSLSSPFCQKQIEDFSNGGTVAHMRVPDCGEILINLPPFLEQKKIAQILSTWDKAISVTEKLLTNSQQQKKALMQQLLTGKKRLLDENGTRFSETWKLYALSKLFQRVTTKNNGKSNNVVTISGQHGLIKQEDFFKKTVASDTLDGYFLLKKGQFAYNKSYSNGYPMGAIKRLNRYPEGVVTTLYICFELTTPKKSCGDYWEHYFESGLLNNSLSQIAHEGGRAHGLLNVKPSDFFSLKVAVPGFEEQQKIASVLSAADTEISTLEKKLACLKDEKKALMQQLLTGKRRVKVDEAVAV
ncbi:restriction endonuclease subunit S [Citrobacter freundii]|nr:MULTISPECIES: restriction endonuclease subunit S [Enterobacteriaceae]POV64412.1 restriction endonuclease subunit S [Citrobacter freundii complex sp. CFNIH11]ASJ98845.1 restriction endonuclease subunit S [Citrobacter freundii]MCV5634062.1 restriction endonuclease subunit S [Escherichia coli]MDV1213558.1 restriction endonuclease subunit S [Citrobacter freundii]MDV1774007.1 restriction endonuclease subunit S [Citrobacter freundii]